MEREGRIVRTYISLCHVREDEDYVVPELSRALATAGFCVAWEYVPPRSRAGAEDFPALTGAVDQSLTYCCYVAILISKAFLARPWGSGNLDGWIPSLRLTGRVFFIGHDVTSEEMRGCSVSLARATKISTYDGIKAAVEMLLSLIPVDQRSKAERLFCAGINPRFAAIVGCQTCDGHPRMYFDFVKTAPAGASGLFVCPCCRQAYAMRDGVAQLRPESAIVPRYPEHSNCNGG